jgi:hypothetical protein
MRPVLPLAQCPRRVVHVLLMLLVGVAASGVLPTSPAAAAEPHVFDGGLFFSDEAVSEADDVIRHIKRAYGRDVMVETYPAVPDELKGELARDGKDKFYENWLNRRARQLGVRGVFVLMTREPGRVQVGVDRATRRRAFTVADEESLRHILASAFRARQFDRGLLDGLRFVDRRMGENTAIDVKPAVPVRACPPASGARGDFWR